MTPELLRGGVLRVLRDPVVDSALLLRDGAGAFERKRWKACQPARSVSAAPLQLLLGKGGQEFPDGFVVGLRLLAAQQWRSEYALTGGC